VKNEGETTAVTFCGKRNGKAGLVEFLCDLAGRRRARTSKVLDNRKRGCSRWQGKENGSHQKRSVKSKSR